MSIVIEEMFDTSLKELNTNNKEELQNYLDRVRELVALGLAKEVYDDFEESLKNLTNNSMSNINKNVTRFLEDVYTDSFNIAEEDINNILEVPIISENRLEERLSEPIAGKTTEQRLSLLKVYLGTTIVDIIRDTDTDSSKEINSLIKEEVTTVNNNIETIATTKGHRMVEQGKMDKVLAVAVISNQFESTKTWNSVEDSLVRSAHNTLNGTTIPLYQDFISPAGGVGYGPGLMNNADDDINCRCYLTYNYSIRGN